MIYMLCRKHVCLVCNSSPCNNKCPLMGPQNCKHLGTTHWGWTRKGCYNLWHVGQLEDGTIKPLFAFSWSAWWSSSPRIAVPIWASWDGEESIDKAMGQLCHHITLAFEAIWHSALPLLHSNICLLLCDYSTTLQLNWTQGIQGSCKKCCRICHQQHLGWAASISACVCRHLCWYE